MPAIVDLVGAISDAVVDALSAAGYPALTDGKILIGRQHLFEQSSAPRIIFVPAGSRFAPRDPTSPARLDGSNLAEQQAQQLQRPIASEILIFEVHVWGQDTSATPPDPDLDFDATQALYQQVMMSLHQLCEGCYKVSPGKWTSGTPQATQLIKAGQEFVFPLEIATPVLDELLAFAPSRLVVNVTDATDAVGAPIEITTSAAHGLSNGNTVAIAAVTGQTLANGSHVVTVTGLTTFTIPINGDGLHDYTGGGTVTIAAVSGAVGVDLTDETGIINHVDVRTS